MLWHLLQTGVVFTFLFLSILKRQNAVKSISPKPALEIILSHQSGTHPHLIGGICIELIWGIKEVDCPHRLSLDSFPKGLCIVLLLDMGGISDLLHI
jgi:hypothetical protein